MSEIIDFRTRQHVSPTQILRRRFELAALRQLLDGTRCLVVGGDTVVTVIGEPDALNRYRVRLEAGEITRVFALPAISLRPIEGNT